MKSLLLILFSFLIYTLHAQQNEPLMEPLIQTGDSVTVIATFKKMNATKDGYYFGGYVVEMSEKEAKQYDGKKIKITGVLNIVEGIGPGTLHYDSLGNLLASQGREGETKYIMKPVIEILEE